MTIPKKNHSKSYVSATRPYDQKIWLLRAQGIRLLHNLLGMKSVMFGNLSKLVTIVTLNHIWRSVCYYWAISGNLYGYDE